jgi:hypothetical protein
MTSDISKYQQDLVRIGSYLLKQIDRPYNLSNPWEESIKNIYQQVKRQGRNRIMAMAYGYYLGELIQLSVTPRAKWLEFVREQKLRGENHFYKGATRTYKLFEGNVEQIYRTEALSFRVLGRMKASEYESLLQYSKDLANLNFDML